MQNSLKYDSIGAQWYHRKLTFCGYSWHVFKDSNSKNVTCRVRFLEAGEVFPVEAHFTKDPDTYIINCLKTKWHAGDL